jgi:hypothetical protein
VPDLRTKDSTRSAKLLTSAVFPLCSVQNWRTAWECRAQEPSADSPPFLSLLFHAALIQQSALHLDIICKSVVIGKKPLKYHQDISTARVNCDDMFKITIFFILTINLLLKQKQPMLTSKRRTVRARGNKHYRSNEILLLVDTVVWYVSLSVLCFQCCGSGSALFLSAVSGFRARRNLIFCHFGCLLKAGADSQSLGRLSLRPRYKKLFLINTIGFIFNCKSLHFGHQNPGSGFGTGSALLYNAGSDFTLKQMHIHNIVCLNDLISSMLAVLSVWIPFPSLRLIGVLNVVSSQNVKIKTFSPTPWHGNGNIFY